MKSAVLAALILPALILPALTLPASAESHEPAFDFAPTALCLAESETLEEKRQCPGRAAVACVEARGYATVVESFCAGAEAEAWDGLLNRAYRAAMAEAKSFDVDQAGTGPSRAEALRAMQRAWIPFRDATCQFEYSAWGGGTGGNPAYAGCLLSLTAEQTLYLENSGGF